MQNAGLAASKAAARIIEISTHVPAPIRAPVGKDAEAYKPMLLASLNDLTMPQIIRYSVYNKNF
jgi:hypothetical protein